MQHVILMLEHSSGHATWVESTTLIRPQTSGSNGQSRCSHDSGNITRRQQCEAQKQSAM